MKNNYTVSDALATCANTILKFHAQLVHKPITPIRLQKLLYIDYGRYLFRGGKEIGNFVFQAWKYGPVLPEIYFFFKEHNISRILEKIPSPDNITYVYRGIGADHINETVRLFLAYTDDDLIEFTHREGGAWSKYYDKHNPGATIPQNEIRQEFKVLGV